MKIFFAVFLLLNSLIGADALRVQGIYDEPPSWFNPKISVSACYACHGDKYPLLERLDGELSVPGGKVERGESPVSAVIREFKEETGITLEENSVFYIKTIYLVDPKKDFFFHVFIFNFEVKPEVVLNEREHQDYMWKTWQESLEMSLIWGEKEVFEIYIEPKIRIRNFEGVCGMLNI